MKLSILLLSAIIAGKSGKRDAFTCLLPSEQVSVDSLIDLRRQKLHRPVNGTSADVLHWHYMLVSEACFSMHLSVSNRIPGDTFFTCIKEHATCGGIRK